MFIGRRILDPEVGGEVDHLHRAGQPCNNLLRGAMGQAAEDGIDLGPVGILHRDHIGQAIAAEMRIDILHRLSGLAVGGQQRDIHIRMPEQEPHGLRSRVTARAEHAGLDFLCCLCHVFLSRQEMRRTPPGSDPV